MDDLISGETDRDRGSTQKLRPCYCLYRNTKPSSVCCAIFLCASLSSMFDPSQAQGLLLACVEWNLEGTVSGLAFADRPRSRSDHPEAHFHVCLPNARAHLHTYHVVPFDLPFPVALIADLPASRPRPYRLGSTPLPSRPSRTFNKNEQDSVDSAQLVGLQQSALLACPTLQVRRIRRLSINLPFTHFLGNKQRPSSANY